MFIKPRLEQEHSNDGSPGGAPATETSTPPTPPATGDIAAVIAEQFKTLLPEITKQVNGAVFANLRKSGALGKPPKGDTETETTSTAKPDDVQALIARERAFGRAINGVKLSDGQYSRMEKAFQLERPDDPTAWVKDYVADLGIGSEAGGQQTKPPAQTRSGPPVSDHGVPGPVVTPSDEADPLKYTEDDYAALVRKEGRTKANAQLRSQFWRSVDGRRIRLR